MFISISDEIGIIVLSNIDNYNVMIQIEDALFNFAEETTFLANSSPDLKPEIFALHFKDMVKIASFDQIIKMNKIGKWISDIFQKALLVSK